MLTESTRQMELLYGRSDRFTPRYGLMVFSVHESRKMLDAAIFLWFLTYLQV